MVENSYMLNADKIPLEIVATRETLPTVEARRSADSWLEAIMEWRGEVRVTFPTTALRHQFIKEELPALLGNIGISAINGIPREELQRLVGNFNQNEPAVERALAPVLKAIGAPEVYAFRSVDAVGALEKKLLEISPELKALLPNTRLKEGALEELKTKLIAKLGTEKPLVVHSAAKRARLTALLKEVGPRGVLGQKLDQKQLHKGPKL